MNGQHADLVITSPPYKNQRAYTQAIHDWDALMQQTFSAIPTHDQTQIIVNIGMVHKDSEVDVWWWDWCQSMRANWRWFGWYVWDKVSPPPLSHGRLTTAHEWLLHFNKQARAPNKTIPKQAKSIGPNKRQQNPLRNQDNTRAGKINSPNSYFNTHKIPQSVLSIHPEKHPHRFTNHPAVFPVKLPQTLIEAYTDPHQIVYDPFAGSATTIIAAHRTNRVGYGIEISPEYADQAIQRLAKETGYTPTNQHGQTFNHLDLPEFFK